MNKPWKWPKLLIERQTMTSVIILGFIVVFVPLAVLVSWYSVSETRNSLRQTADVNLTTVAVQVRSEVERALLRSYQDIETLADNPVIKSDMSSAEDKLAEMRKVQNFYRIFTDITIIDTDGNVITSTTYGYQGDWGGKEWFHNAVGGNASVSRPYSVLSPNQLFMDYAAPVVSGDHNAASVIVGQMDMTTIWDIIDDAKLGETGYAGIIDDSGRYIAHPNKGKLFTSLEHPENEFWTIPGSGKVELFKCENSSGDKARGVYAAIDIGKYTGGHAWYVIMRQSADEIFSLAHDTLRRVVSGIAGAFLLFIIISVFFIKRATKPIHDLSDGAERVGSGELTYRVPVSGTQEVRYLAASFNEMVSSFQKIESLKAEHNLLRKLQAAGTALAGALSPDEVLLIITNSIRDILDSDVVWILIAEEGGKCLETMVFISPRKEHISSGNQISACPVVGEVVSLANDSGLLAKTFKDGKPLFLEDLAPFKGLAMGDPLLEVMAMQPDMTSLNIVPLILAEKNVGIMVFGRIMGKPLSDVEKRIVLVFAHQAVISLERARLRAMELESTAELTRLNDLKSRLLHILSHELKTPLTSLRSSAMLLKEADISSLDVTTQQRLVGNITRATEKLIAVADDIYPIAEAVTGRMMIERKNTDCRRLVDGAVEEVLPLTSKKAQAVNISVPDSVPKVHVDREHLKQVLVNLLTNASNLSPQGSRIDVLLQDKESEVIFEVRDEGIGISETDQKSIFDGFYQADSEIVRRAHGKGLGLLFAKTVVGLHGGKIWVKSKLGEGSSFFFSIPKQT
ncbi:MAG: cache domain-containing protein [Dehalococcoidia bacterium]